MDEIDAIMRRLHYKICESFADGHRLIPADEERITRFEAEIGHNLPHEYRCFLQRYQGAWIWNAELHPTIQHEHLQSVEGVHSIHFLGFYSTPPGRTKSPHDLPWRAQLLKDDLPVGVIPVAEFLQQTYYFCVSCAPETYGQVFIKAREECDDDIPADFIFPHAPSFLEFLRSLRTMTDEEADEWYRKRSE